jgi:hypothetical protein
MLLLPSRGRPDQLKRFFDESKPKVKGLLILDEDDWQNYSKIELPARWDMFIGPNLRYAKKLNQIYSRYPSESWYGWVGDDFVCPTPNWDVELSAHALEGRIAWGDDTINGERNACAPFFPGTLVRALGWFACPAFTHLYVDQIWWELARDLRIAKYRADIITKAYHWSQGNQVFDATAAGRGSDNDHQAYGEYKQERYAQDLALCKAALEKEKPIAHGCVSSN